MLGILCFKKYFRAGEINGECCKSLQLEKWKFIYIFPLLSNGNSFFISFIIYTILNPFCMFGHSRAFYELTFFFGSLSSFPSARVNKINNSWLFSSLIMCLIMLWLTLDCSTHHLSLSSLCSKKKEASRHNKMCFSREKFISFF